MTGFDLLGPEITTQPSLPLFSHAVNVKKFALCSEGLPHLGHFALPNLTSFELLTFPEETFSDEEAFPILQLLDFLEATPTLQTVSLAVHMETSLAGVPPGRIVILPNVEGFYTIEQEPHHRIAAKISCPSTKHASLICEQGKEESTPQDVFPTGTAWRTIPSQYMVSRVDAIALELDAFRDLSCSLFFLSQGSATLQLGHKIFAAEGDDGPRPSLPREYAKTFSLASMAIWSHPLLANVKRLRIQDRHLPLGLNRLKCVANEVRLLFKSFGPLDEMALDASDLRPYLVPFIDLPSFHRTRVTPTCLEIKGLTVANHPLTFIEAAFRVGIVEFAKSQHESGIPFEYVVFQAGVPPAEIVEGLRPWVGTVLCQ